MLKIGSLCSGYGGLDMAVEAYFNAETVWMCDNDKYASIVIKERWNLPNLGDLKAVDWSTVEPIDILTAGYPCQPFSQAGQRKGENDERHIWPYIKQIISATRPRYIVLENVRGHLSLGFKEVLKDLAEIRYDAKWQIVRASDIGAPHRRERLFIIAEPSNTDSERSLIRGQEEEGNKRKSQFEPCQCSQIAANPTQQRCKNKLCAEKSNKLVKNNFELTANTYNSERKRIGNASQFQSRFDTQSEMRLRRTPNALDLSNRLNPQFVEYMMGLPEGWVTDLDISRSQQLKILGNGVVPQQAYYALQLLCDTPIIEREKQMNLTEALC
jgi:DNA (cytosine-5)-methyltransferase 1